MKAVILVGGLGKRLRKIISDRPKPMALINGQPFLELLLIYLRKKKINDIILCTGYKGHKVEEYFGEGVRFDLNITYSREQSPLGTGGAVRNALNHFKNERFLVLNGDSFCNFDTDLLLQAHEETSAKATMWLVAMNDCRRFGSVDIRGNGIVTSFREKSSALHSGLINAGVYLIERSIIENIPEDCAVSLETEVFPQLVENGLYAVAGDGPFLDIGTPESFTEAQSFFLTNR